MLHKCTSGRHEWLEELHSERCCHPDWTRVLYDPKDPPENLDPAGRSSTEEPPLWRGWVKVVPNYLMARTGSATEKAMVAAENATRVPLNEDGHFKMMDFTKEAMDNLDRVHHSDQVTRELVRSKIGKAQARFGY